MRDFMSTSETTWKWLIKEENKPAVYCKWNCYPMLGTLLLLFLTYISLSVGWLLCVLWEIFCYFLQLFLLLSLNYTEAKRSFDVYGKTWVDLIKLEWSFNHHILYFILSAFQQHCIWLNSKVTTKKVKISILNSISVP